MNRKCVVLKEVVLKEVVAACTRENEDEMCDEQRIRLLMSALQSTGAASQSSNSSCTCEHTIEPFKVPRSESLEECGLRSPKTPQLIPALAMRLPWV